MNHFSKKYIKGIAGAGMSKSGGGGGRSSNPPPPPPPTLKPPKLGDLQSLSSYDYAESIDLISDGEIDGLVGANGEYVDNLGIFESIYLDDVVIRLPVTSTLSMIIGDYDLSFIGSAFQNKFYSNNKFIETSKSNLAGFAGSNSSGSVSFSVLTTKDNISEEIFRSREKIRIAYSEEDAKRRDYPSLTNASTLKQLLFLTAQFNFSSRQELSANLLSDFPEHLSEDYPFLALKISLNADLRSLQELSTGLIVLKDDIYNQIYYDLEATELQNKKILSPKKRINTTFFETEIASNFTSKTFARGDFYVFFYQRDGFVLENGVSAIIKHLKSIKVLNAGAKFNYANATCEIRDGADLQKPLSLFNKTYLDIPFFSRLRGPFVAGQQVSSLLIRPDFKTLDTAAWGGGGAGDYTFVGSNGSDDNRLANGAPESYSDWNKNYISYALEPSSSITHIVLNPNVDQVFVTVQVSTLTDTAHQNLTLLKEDKKNESVEAGAQIPALIEFSIETGYQSSGGREEVYLNRNFQVKGVVTSPVSIDVGREETARSYQTYWNILKFINNPSDPIRLPPYVDNKNRFVRVSRVTAESYSSLIRREINLSKITEIINVPFSYPYSAICGLKLDARTFNSIPSRSYDARFKKVFVPSNYFPLKASGKDKRYLTVQDVAYFNSLFGKNLVDFNNTEERLIYKGNWDGTFKLAWTDNPVWVLFDILISRRYGLGNFVSPSEINYWELYKIGRYCDAVDSNGVFVGVPSTNGGLEPRYAFNGVIADKTNVFESLKSLVACFRGNMFYTNSQINFTNDRLKPIMAFFNNANVKDGSFNYSNERRDSQYNVIEVTYLDREDLFKQKIEYVEDTDDIKARGILRTTAQTFGITSRAHAKRLGEHIIYSTINEDENVAFVGGLETLLCRPGDLISIDDEVKTLKNHVGRVLSVDPVTNSIYTNISLRSSDFSSSGLTGEISVLIPTGKLQSESFYDLAKSPSKLNISEIYQTDLPMRVTFQSTGRQVSPSLSYGSNFFIDTECAGYPLFQDIRVGSPCSITVANTKQQIYKIQSIKEFNLNEYEVIASKFDTGKFSEIEKGETGLMQDFFTSFPSARNTNVSEGKAVSLENKFQYELKFPTILAFATGNWNLQFDKIDLSGQWTGVANANSYNVELITPKYKSIKQIVTGTSAIFEDQTEVGKFTLKVTARNTGSYPNPISATASSTRTVLSYAAPVRNNGIIQGFVINR
jgi:hypothetical protein